MSYCAFYDTKVRLNYLSVIKQIIKSYLGIIKCTMFYLSDLTILSLHQADTLDSQVTVMAMSAGV